MCKKPFYEQDTDLTWWNSVIRQVQPTARVGTCGSNILHSWPTSRACDHVVAYWSLTRPELLQWNSVIANESGCSCTGGTTSGQLSGQARGEITSDPELRCTPRHQYTSPITWKWKVKSSDGCRQLLLSSLGQSPRRPENPPHTHTPQILSSQPIMRAPHVLC